MLTCCYNYASTVGVAGFLTGCFLTFTSLYFFRYNVQESLCNLSKKLERIENKLSNVKTENREWAENKTGTGKYMTNREVDIKNKLWNEIQGPLTRDQEQAILNQFENIRGKSWEEAAQFCKDLGYILYPTYIEHIPHYLPEFNIKIIGVRVDKFDYETNTVPPNATVTHLIDVGGVDFYKNKILWV